MAWLVIQNCSRHFNHFNKKVVLQRFYSSRKGVILGIETSCDDTGCAIVDTEGNILGESLNSQLLVHLNNGGIIPPIARDLHRKHIEHIVEEAVTLANLNFDDIDAVATTVKPELPLESIMNATLGDPVRDRTVLEM